MKYFNRLVIIIIFFSCIATNIRAQFSLTGSDPAALRWRQMETENFRLIFPEGNDSLARVYGKELEAARLKVAGSGSLTLP